MAAVTYVAGRRRDQPGVSWRDLMSGFNAFWVEDAEGGKRKPFANVSSFIQAVVRGTSSLSGLVKVSPHVELLLAIDRRRRDGNRIRTASRVEVQG